MKKLFSRWKCISRPKKILILILAMCLMVLIAYISAGCPPLTAKMALRQAEKDAMLGPCEVIAEFQQESTAYNHVIVGQSEHTYTLLSYDPEMRVSQLSSYGITGNSALYPLPGSHPYSKGEPLQPGNLNNPLNLILFDTEPKAQRAEIELEITYQYNETYTKFLSVEAVREHNSFFLFSFYCQDTGTDSVNQAALLELQDLCSEYDTHDLPVTVRYYDAKDALIRTETIFAGPSA